MVGDRPLVISFISCPIVLQASLTYCRYCHERQSIAALHLSAQCIASIHIKRNTIFLQLGITQFFFIVRNGVFRFQQEFTKAYRL